MNPINDPELVAREYAALDGLGSRRLDRTGWLRDAGEPIQTMLGAIAEAHPRRVLDLGCGTGELAALVSAPEIICVDSSPASVRAARARGLDALVGDVQSLPFGDGEFDVALGNWMLYHLPDLDRGLAEIARVLRPGGRFIGCYNRKGHLHELWLRVNPDLVIPDDYGEPLGWFFARVERRHTRGEVVWLTRADLQAYLDAYVEIAGSMTAPEGPYPFMTRRRNCVWVAER